MTTTDRLVRLEQLRAELATLLTRTERHTCGEVPVRSVTARVKAILRAFPDDPALDGLVGQALLWGLLIP